MTRCHARHNIMALKFFSFLDALYPMSILAIVWFYTVTGSYTAAAMMFGIQTIAQAILEIPTGVLSDKYSRVFNLRCSAFLWFASYFLTAMAGTSSYGTLVLIIAAIVGGLAGALNSGTKEALIYETLADCRRQNKFDFVYSRIMFWEQIGAMFGAGIAAGLMFLSNIYVVAWATVVIGFLFFVSAFWLQEPASRQRSELSSWNQVWVAFRQIWTDKKLRKLIGIRMLDGPYGYFMEGAYFATLIPASLIPFARLFRQFTGAVGFYLAKFVKKIGFLRTLIYASGGASVAKLMGLVINGIATPFVNSSTNLFYGFDMTAYNALLQENFSDQQRATMQNIQSLLMSIGGCATLFIFGKIADHYSILTAMWWSVVMDFIVTFAYWKLFKNKKINEIKNEKI